MAQLLHPKKEEEKFDEILKQIVLEGKDPDAQLAYKIGMDYHAGKKVNGTQLKLSSKYHLN